MIAFYNHNVGDVLMLIMADNEGQALSYEKKGSIARVFREDSADTVAWNFFGKTTDKDGTLQLTTDEIEELNNELLSVGFDAELPTDSLPTFVVAEIMEMEPHPDSDHLNICQVAIGNGELTQIVCGAPNARVGLKSVAALPGAMMPDGKLIWTGSLRGVISHGMLCSPRELALPNAPQERGIIDLNDALSVGIAFDAVTMWKQ